MKTLPSVLFAAATLFASLPAMSADAKPATTKPPTTTSTKPPTTTSTSTPTPTKSATPTKPAPPTPPPPAAPLSPSAEVADEDFGHGRQFNIRAEFVTGYRMLFRYDKSPRCAPYNYEKKPTDQQKFCGYGAPPGLGVAVGFALLDFFEPYAFVRLGLSDEASQTNQGKLLQVGAGARIYTMSDSRFKIFFSPWLGVDMTEGPVQPSDGRAAQGTPGKDDASANIPPAAYRTDLLVHLDIGPQYDLSKGFGIYMSGGLTFQMLRYLGASADLAIGVQLRAP